MRKIEQNMIAAVKALRSAGDNATWQKDNTQVVNHAIPNAGSATEIMLHGHHIATISENDSLTISLAGWNTNTTRSRLSALIGGFARIGRWPYGTGVSTRKGQAYIHDAKGKRPIDDNGWYPVALGE